MLSWFTGLGMAVKVGIVLAILALVAGTVWYVHHAIWKDGYNAATVKLQPVIDKLTVDLKNSQADLTTATSVNATFAAENKRLAAIVNDQNLRVQTYEAKAIEAQNKARTAINELQKQQRNNAAWKAELARLQAIVNGPAMKEGDCEEADAILRTLVRDRMPVGPVGAAAPAGGAAPARAPGS